MVVRTHVKLVVSTVVADVGNVTGVLKLHFVALSAHHDKHPARLVCDAFVGVRSRGGAVLLAKHQHNVTNQTQIYIRHKFKTHHSIDCM